jgi:uncharacterized membrane protein YccC
VQRSVVIGRTRHGVTRALSERLPVPLRPASSGPVRYWQDRSRLAAKGAIAAAAAWALARYAAGQADPYFAPLAALLGVYPTVAGSLREGLQYIGGFLLGAALAIPVSLVLGPSVAGIAVVVLAGILAGGWRRLEGQSAQVTFTALLVLLLGGYQPLHYLTPRMVDVGIGVATGLAVNVLVFPPLQLRPAEHAVRLWGDDIAAALQDLAGAAAGPHPGARFWPRHDRQLTAAAQQARTAVGRARESLRWNPRAKVERAVPRPDGAVIDSLEALTARTRAIARSLLDTPSPDQAAPIPASFGENYAAMLRMLTGPVRQLADLRSPRPCDELTEARGCQRRLERQAARLPGHSDQSSEVHHLTRLTRDIIRELAGDQPARD